MRLLFFLLQGFYSPKSRIRSRTLHSTTAHRLASGCRRNKSERGGPVFRKPPLAASIEL